MKYRVTDHTIELSVNELCYFACGTSPLGERPLSVLYEKEKGLFPEDYRQEQTLFGFLEKDGVRYELTGEADGLFSFGSVWTVDVVRLAGPREKKRRRREWLAYGQLLALLLSMREGCDKMRVRLVTVGLEDGDIGIEEKKVSYESLRGFAEGLLSLVALRARVLIERETQGRVGALDLPFPYPEIREGQEEMIRGVMSAMRRGKRMFVCAPTGIGKTISALYPAVRAFGAGLCDKIFYLTAKSSTSLEAYHAAGKLFSAGASLRTVVLSSKETMCRAGTVGRPHCHASECPCLSDNVSTRMNEAISELLGRQNGFYPSVIREMAEKHRVCAYELSLSLSELCDIIICDYNYLFDPIVHLKRYFDGEHDFGEYVFLLDEAHNLADRAREMYSARLSKKNTEEIYAAIPKENRGLAKLFENLLSAMEAVREVCHENRQAGADGEFSGYYIGKERQEAFDQAVTAFYKTVSTWLYANQDHELYDLISGFFQDIRRYVAILSRYDEKFVTYIEETAEEVSVSLLCIDPCEVVGERLDMGRSSVLFSATLTPLSYFSDLLGGDKKSVFLSLTSPYEAENLCVAAVDSISTRLEDRDKSYKRVATCIAAAVSGRAGNYMVYFPSYGYLEKVHEAFLKKYKGVCTVVQKKGMTLAQKEEFLASFPEDTGKMRIGFCVLGGSFSEGVDLPGSRLIGSIIVGVGLPGFSSERNIMRDYFQNRYENGFEYAYTYPGMNNVLQAAGRVIRREEDRGIVVLIDDRYGTPTYQKLFPKHWGHLKYAGNPSSLAEIVRKFWENSK